MLLGLPLLYPVVARMDQGGDANGPPIQTVCGPVPAAELGLTVGHEHVLVDFIGADRVSPDRYSADEAYRIAARISTCPGPGGKPLYMPLEVRAIGQAPA